MNENDVYKIVCDRIIFFAQQNHLNTALFNFNLKNKDAYPILLAIKYSFHPQTYTNTIAGGKPASIDFGEDLASFTKETRRLIAFSNDVKNEKDNFVEKLLKKPIDAVCNEKKEIIWSSKDISYKYTCKVCYGKGQVTCSSCSGKGKSTCSSCYGSGDQMCYGCSGSGYNTVSQSSVDSQGNTHYNQVRRSCGTCGGRGRTRCSGCHGTGMAVCGSCGGSGKTVCGTCSGHGYLRGYFKAYTEVHKKPSLKYKKDGMQVKKIVDLLQKNNNAYYVKHFNPKLYANKWEETGEYTLTLSGNAQVVKTEINVEKSKHIEYGVNTIGALLFPPIFDDFFNDIYHYNIKIKEGYKRFIINNTPLRSFFYKKDYNDLRKKPIIDDAFKHYSIDEYSNIDKNNRTFKLSEEVSKFAGGLISKSAAFSIAETAEFIIDSVAPKTTQTLWLSVYLAMFSLVSFLTYYYYKLPILETTTSHFGIIQIILTSMFFLFIIYGFTFGVLAPVASFTNNVITQMRQLSVDYNHRQRVISNKHLKSLYLLNFFTMILTISAMYIYKTIGNSSEFFNGLLKLFGIHPYIKKTVNVGEFNYKTAMGKGVYDQFTGIVHHVIQQTVNIFDGVPSLLNFFGMHMTHHEYVHIVENVIVFGPFVYFLMLPLIISLVRGKYVEILKLLLTLIISPFLLFIPWFILLFKSLA